MCAVDSAYMNVNISRTQVAEIFFTYEKEYLSVEGTDTSLVTEIYGSLIDSDGNFLWPDQDIPISMAMSNKLHLDLSDFSSDQWIMAWEDQRLHIADPMNSGIYAQNVTIDGNLGPLYTVENSSGQSGLIRCYPNPCSDLVCLEYELDQKSDVVISLNDCLGNVLYLKNEEMNDIGKHLVEFPVNGLNPGVYLIKLHTQDYSRCIKVIKKN
jgi:hypothetical protein